MGRSMQRQLLSYIFHWFSVGSLAGRAASKATQRRWCPIATLQASAPCPLRQEDTLQYTHSYGRSTGALQVTYVQYPSHVPPQPSVQVYNLASQPIQVGLAVGGAHGHPLVDYPPKYLSACTSVPQLRACHTIHYLAS